MEDWETIDLEETLKQLKLKPTKVVVTRPKKKKIKLYQKLDEKDKEKLEKERKFLESHKDLSKKQKEILIKERNEISIILDLFS